MALSSDEQDFAALIAAELEKTYPDLATAMGKEVTSALQSKLAAKGALNADTEKLAKLFGEEVAQTLQEVLKSEKPNKKESDKDESASKWSFIGGVLGGAVGAKIGGVLSHAKQSNAGKSVLGSSFDVLAGTVGTTLTPVFTVLAAGVLALSDYIWELLLPNLDRWVEAIIKGATELADWIDRRKQDIGGFLDVGGNILTGEFTKVAEQFERDNPAHILGDERGGGLVRAALPPEEVKGAGVFEDGPDKSIGGRFRSALGDVVTEMRMKLSTSHGYLGLADAQKKAQEAAFQSPFETRQLQYLEAMQKSLEKVAANTAKPQYQGSSGDAGMSF